MRHQRSGVLLGHPYELLHQHRVKEVHVLLFNAGRHDEGVYTLQGREGPMEANSFVLAFEQLEEAERFALLLQAQGSGLPEATRWAVEQLGDFCEMAEFGLSFVPHGTLFMPPQQFCYDDDAFAALERQQMGEEGPPSGSPSAQAVAEENDRLREIRERLERLYGEN